MIDTVGKSRTIEQGGSMPIDPTREKEVREQVETEFAEIERASEKAVVGIHDVLRVYGGLELASRQANTYLTLLNPVSPRFSTTSSTNVER
jgi:hypothetical protein